MSEPIKPGDTVRHRPSGEEWLVAFVRGDDLAWCGWPEGLARLSDCELVEVCSAEESEQLIQHMAQLREPDRRGRWARQHLSSRGGRR